MNKTKEKIVPKLGMGVTEFVGSDCYPYTIIGISASKKIMQIQSDNYKPTADHEYYGNQDYDYTTDPQGRTYFISLRKDGRWRQVGSGRGSTTYGIGVRRAYSDPSF